MFSWTKFLLLCSWAFSVQALAPPTPLQQKVAAAAAVVAANIPAPVLAAVVEDDYEYGAVDAPIGIALAGGVLAILTGTLENYTWQTSWNKGTTAVIVSMTKYWLIIIPFVHYSYFFLCCWSFAAAVPVLLKPGEEALEEMRENEGYTFGAKDNDILNKRR